MVMVTILMVAVAATVSTLLTVLIVSLSDTDDGVQESQQRLIRQEMLQR